MQSGGNKMPGEALRMVGLLATSNPAGLVVGSAVKAVGEASGGSRIESRATATAKESLFSSASDFSNGAGQLPIVLKIAQQVQVVISGEHHFRRRRTDWPSFSLTPSAQNATATEDN